MNSEFWNERYSAGEYVYGREPNDFLREFIEPLQPGKLLLPGEGEGRNAVYAAKKGWIVDAFDTSSVAMEKALGLASEKGVKISYQIENILFYQPKTDFYNLVALLFVHLPRIQRRYVSARMFESLRPGGKIIMEVFSIDQIKFGTGGPNDPNLLYSEKEIITDFPCFKIESLLTIERELNEGAFHKGIASVIRFIGVK